MDSPLVQPRCCERSSSPADCGPFRRHPRTRGRTWSRSRYCRSSPPIPSPASLARQRRHVATAPGGCNHTCTTWCYPRCTPGRLRASPPHSWWRRWRPFLDNLQQSRTYLHQTTVHFNWKHLQFIIAQITCGRSNLSLGWFPVIAIFTPPKAHSTN